MLRSVSIVAGKGEWFGSGHWSRMEVLADLLRTQRVEVRMLPAETEADAARIFLELDPGKDGVRVLDARDADPSPGVTAGGVLIDNRCPARPTLTASYFFFDTIPHPALGLSSVMENALIDPQLAKLARAPARKRDLITAYVPAHRDASKVDELLIELSARLSIARTMRVGGPPSKTDGVECAERMERREFLQLLVESRIVVSYFGMTILEAWQAGALPVLTSIGSAVHDRLSLDLSNRTSIPFLTGQRVERWVPPVREALDSFDKAGGIRSRTSEIIQPGLCGYERLIDVLEKSAGSSLQQGRVR